MGAVGTYRYSHIAPKGRSYTVHRVGLHGTRGSTQPPQTRMR